MKNIFFLFEKASLYDKNGCNIDIPRITIPDIFIIVTELNIIHIVTIIYGKPSIVDIRKRVVENLNSLFL
jgi:hypothetical protein